MSIDPEMLAWLWDVIAQPILGHFGFSLPRAGDSLPRIFWILTGELSLFPIHAAGRHTACSGDSVMDRVLSSYALTLKTFVGARMMTPRYTNAIGSLSMGKALLVDNEETPRFSKIRYATAEVDELEGICPALNLEPVRIPRATPAAVLEHMDAAFFHFAGHGISDPVDPTRNGLWLEDRRFTVKHFNDHNVHEHHPFLAYLSVRHTEQHDETEIHNQEINLVSSFHVSGFRHVIGALWQAKDEPSALIAGSVYRGIAERGMTDRSVCEALHETVVRLRNAWVDKMKEWKEINDFMASSYRGIGSEETSENSSEDDASEQDGSLEEEVARFLALDWALHVHYGA